MKINKAVARTLYKGGEDQLFYDICHEFADAGDKMNYCIPQDELFAALSPKDMKIAWQTYIWHYNRAMERSKK